MISFYILSNGGISGKISMYDPYGVDSFSIYARITLKKREINRMRLPSIVFPLNAGILRAILREVKFSKH